MACFIFCNKFKCQAAYHLNMEAIFLRLGEAGTAGRFYILNLHITDEEPYNCKCFILV